MPTGYSRNFEALPWLSKDLCLQQLTLHIALYVHVLIHVITSLTTSHPLALQDWLQRVSSAAPDRKWRHVVTPSMSLCTGTSALTLNCLWISETTRQSTHGTGRYRQLDFISSHVKHIGVARAHICRLHVGVFRPYKFNLDLCRTCTCMS